MDTDFLIIVVSMLLLGFLLGSINSSRSKKTRDSNSQSQQDCNEFYVKGLNYLLEKKSDKAIELFTNLIKVDQDTIETHVALGNLFRSKGEVDRAIQVHQNLIARPNLDLQQRLISLTELAEDYLKAGLLDRAENLFLEILEIKPEHKQAQRRLMELYLVEENWLKAIHFAAQLLALGEQDCQEIVSQCQCELAERLIAEGNLKHARERIISAIHHDDRCVRCKILLIDIFLKSSDFKKAEPVLKQLLQAHPEYLSLYLKQLKIIFEHNYGRQKYQDFLRERFDQYPRSNIAIELIKTLQESGLQSENQISEVLSVALDNDANLELMAFTLSFINNNSLLKTSLVEKLAIQADKQSLRNTHFVCQNCGFGSQSIHWCCPSCKSWSSMKPV